MVAPLMEVVGCCCIVDSDGQGFGNPSGVTGKGSCGCGCGLPPWNPLTRSHTHRLWQCSDICAVTLSKM